MKRSTISGAIAALALGAGTFAAVAEDWQPSGPINMMIAFRAGGGADTLGRLLAEDIATARGWKIIPQNVAGKGGGAMAVALKGEPSDGLAIGVTVAESITYGSQAARNPGYALEDFEYLSTITGTQMGIIAKADRGWTDLGDVIAAAKAGEKITIGAMSPKLADAAYVIGKYNDVEFTTVMVKGGKGGINGVVADDLDVAWAAGPQAAGVKAGDLINLVSAEVAALNVSPDAPLLSSFGVPYTFGTRFIVVAPAGLPDDARAALQAAIAEALKNPDSKVAGFTNKAFSGPIVVQGDEFAASMSEEFDAAARLLDDSAN